MVEDRASHIIEDEFQRLAHFALWFSHRGRLPHLLEAVRKSSLILIALKFRRDLLELL